MRDINSMSRGECLGQKQMQLITMQSYINYMNSKISLKNKVLVHDIFKGIQYE